MNKNICKIIILNKEKFIPHLFTKKQVETMQKHVQNKLLTNTEKTYLYSTIKKKIEALQVLKEEWYITGKDMIPERVEQVKEILKEINREK